MPDATPLASKRSRDVAFAQSSFRESIIGAPIEECRVPIPLGTRPSLRLKLK